MEMFLLDEKTCLFFCLPEIPHAPTIRTIEVNGEMEAMPKRSLLMQAHIMQIQTRRRAGARERIVDKKFHDGSFS